ncbi:MAG: hypothetical protein QOF11_1572 [Chloroflexota bacterium]|nr:hypothetical protein [Chloroflexota bacterium]
MVERCWSHHTTCIWCSAPIESSTLTRREEWEPQGRLETRTFGSGVVYLRYGADTGR